MIIFAWKVNNPLSLLISRGPVKALNHFVNDIPVCLRIHTVYCITVKYLPKQNNTINVNHTVFLHAQCL